MRLRLTAMVAVGTTILLVILAWIMILLLRAALIDEARIRNQALTGFLADTFEKDSSVLSDLMNERGNPTLSDTFAGRLNQLMAQTQVSIEREASDWRLGGGQAQRGPIPLLGPPADQGAFLNVVSSQRQVTIRGRIGETGAATQEVVLLTVTTPLNDVDESVRVVRNGVWVVVPAMVVVFTSVAWVMSGSTLRPVHDVTRTVRRLSAPIGSERVPVPRKAAEVAELAETMNGLLDRLEEATRKERRLLSDASHEMRSPVATLRTQLETALKIPDRTDWPQVAGTALHQSRRLENLVSDLFTMARLEESDSPLPVTEVDLDELIMEECVSRPRVDVSRVVAGRVRGDVVQLASVIRNLVDNADRHADTQVAVSLGPGPEPDIIRLVVDDDGLGIPVDRRSVVFDRFARLQEGRSRDSGGAGLGLALVKRVVTRHRGRVWIEDSPLGGARFVVDLPAVRDEDEPPIDSVPAAPPLRPPQPTAAAIQATVSAQEASVGSITEK